MRFILMADIKESSKFFPPTLQRDFAHMVKHFNKAYSSTIVSPLTITLGDEFQGIVKDVQTGLNIIVAMEEYILTVGLEFKLRYILNEGEIETPINTEIAHGMMGSGLTKARQLLLGLKRDRRRFEIRLNDMIKATTLNGLFFLYQHFMDRWHKKDLVVASLFLKDIGNKEVASRLKRDESSVWRKRRSLAIDEYLICRTILLKAA